MPGTYDDNLLDHIRAYLSGTLPNYEGGSIEGRDLEDLLMEYLTGTLPSYQGGSFGAGGGGQSYYGGGGGSNKYMIGGKPMT